MRRILVLTAGFGEGHNSAARQVCEALNLRDGVVATVHDPFVAFGKRYEDSKRRYVAAVSGAPILWRFGYHALDRLPLAQLSLPFLGPAEKLLEATLRETGADTVVSTYPVYPWLLRRIARRGGPKVKIVTIVTDSITINRVWAKAPSDLWLTADRYSAKILGRLGVSTKSVHTTGFPVSPSFTRPPAETRPHPTGDIPGGMKILLMAGVSARETVAFAAALTAIPGVALTVGIGRRADLGDTVLRALEKTGRTATILGWTDKMPELLRTHHLLLGKAGGATTHETLAARTPFLITHALPGQEEGNAKLIARLNAGELVTTPAAAAAAVAGMLRDNARLWCERVTAIEKHTRTDGALRAAEVILA